MTASTMSTQGPLFIWSAIMRLFHPSSPSAVFGRIWAVVIDSLESHLWMRPSSHISKEIDIVIEPAITDYNAASTVIRIMGVSNIGRPLDHIVPGSIFQRLSPSPCIAVLNTHERTFFSLGFFAFSASGSNSSRISFHFS